MTDIITSYQPNMRSALSMPCSLHAHILARRALLLRASSASVCLLLLLLLPLLFLQMQMQMVK